jgi:vesicular inhibitory amino acid transporter
MAAHANNLAKTVLLIVGEMAGSGLIALPNALLSAGPALGIALLLLCAALSAYTGILLGRCWTMVTTQSPQARAADALALKSLQTESAADDETRRGSSGGGGGGGTTAAAESSPILTHGDDSDGGDAQGGGVSVEARKSAYLYIGRAALGPAGGVVVAIVLLLTLVGVCVLFLIQSSVTLHGVSAALPVRGYIVLLAALLVPLSWLESPKDFWQAAGVAVAATASVSIGVVVLSRERAPTPFPGLSPVGAGSVFSALSVMFLAFGGAMVFPTIQVDMAEPARFSRALAVSYAALLAMYVPVSLVGVLSFGSALRDNEGTILNSLLPHPGAKALSVILVLHLLTALVVLQNPVGQLLDLCLRVPPGFSWRRCAARSSQVVAFTALALSVPHSDFFCVMGLVGGSTMALTTFIFPTVFYLALLRKGYSPPGAAPAARPRWGALFVAAHALLVAFAVVAGAAATKSAADSCPWNDAA